MPVAVRPASVSRRACALAAVTVAVEKRLCRKLQGLSEARKLVSANSQVRGCPAGKIHRKRYPVKVKPSGKTGQLSCLVSGLSKQEAVAVYTRGSKSLLPGQACL